MGKLRKCLSIGGVALTMFLCAAWLASGWYSLWYGDGGLPRYTLSVSAYSGYARIDVFPKGPRQPQGFSHDRGVTIERREQGFDLSESWTAPLIHPGLYRSTVCFVPAWCLVLPAAILTLIVWKCDFVGWGRAMIARRRIRLSKCPHCAFDLVGLASDAACPECGKLRTPT